MEKPVRVGFDFDGVIAYNPIRIIRAPISLFKRYILKKRKLSFYYPKTPLERFIWMIVHDSSVYPGVGIDLFKRLVTEKKIDAHLITGRYGYLDEHLMNWLKKYDLEKYFSSINMNIHNKQPHLFKEEVINKLELSYFIEDNLDIVTYLNSKFVSIPKSVRVMTKNSKNQTKIFWIYNVVDFLLVDYPHKFPYLKKAIEEIIK